MNHLKTLLDRFSKDHHLLTASVLNPLDRQNFQSVMRICDNRVINLLKKKVPRSEGTVKFLEILQNIIQSYMDQSLLPLQRINKIWYSIFILRIWREYILTNKDLTLKEKVVTSNCYICIELNAHSLVQCLLYLKKNDLSINFLPHLFSSQPCEGQFRRIRSFISTFSTVANCSVKEIMSRITKIELQYDISSTFTDDFIYSKKSASSESSNNTNFPLPTVIEISDEIKKCKSKAIQDAIKIGL